MVVEKQQFLLGICPSTRYGWERCPIEHGGFSNDMLVFIIFRVYLFQVGWFNHQRVSLQTGLATSEVLRRGSTLPMKDPCEWYFYRAMDG